MLEDKTVTVGRHDVKLAKSFGMLYACGYKTNNVWYRVISQSSNDQLTCLVPEGNVSFFEEKKDFKKSGFKKPKPKTSWVKTQAPGYVSPANRPVAKAPIMPLKRMIQD